MNKQVIIAGVLAAVAAQDPVVCDGAFVAEAEDALRLAEEVAERKLAEVQPTADAASDQATNDAWDKAAEDALAHTELMAANVARAAALAQEAADFETARGVAAAAAGALVQTLSDRTGDATTAAQAVVAHQLLIDAQIVVVDRLSDAVTRLVADVATLTATSLAADAEWGTEVAAKAALDDEQAAYIAQSTTRWAGSLDPNCVADWREFPADSGTYKFAWAANLGAEEDACQEANALLQGLAAWKAAADVVVAGLPADSGLVTTWEGLRDSWATAAAAEYEAKAIHLMEMAGCAPDGVDAGDCSNAAA
jgi:hypothetical protein